MLDEPIEVPDRQLLRQLAAMGGMSQVPADLIRELARVQMRLNAHVHDLQIKKAQLDAARAELEEI